MTRYKLSLSVRTDLPAHPLDDQIMALFRELRVLISERAAARISAANKGKVKSDEHVANIRAHHATRFGYAHSAETRAKISRANKGRRQSPAHRAKISKSKLA